MAKRWYTVVGVCEEQRHFFYIKAENAKIAEEKTREDHDTETTYTLYVAGVFRGRLKPVDIAAGDGTQIQLVEAQKRRLDRAAEEPRADRLADTVAGMEGGIHMDEEGLKKALKLKLSTTPD